MSVPDTVRAARQAVAMDEHRISYSVVRLANPTCAPTSRIRERMFRGAHADVGGGYGDDAVLYKFPLVWMWREAVTNHVPLAALSSADRLPYWMESLPLNSAFFDNLIHDSASYLTDPMEFLLDPSLFSRANRYPPGCPAY